MGGGVEDIPDDAPSEEPRRRRLAGNTQSRDADEIDTPLALVGSMLAGLLVIAVLSPSPKAAPSIAVQATHPTPASAPRALLPKPVPVHRVTQPSALRPQAVIYASDPQNYVQLREWKRRNAASMKILEKTTKEVRLR